MQYYVTFTVFLDSDVKHSEDEIKEAIKEGLESSSVSVENMTVEHVKHI